MVYISIAIYALYTPNGIIYDYVITSIKSIKKIAGKVIVVINGNIDSEGKNKLLDLKCDIYERENTGFDGGAYKDVILNYLSYDEWKTTERLILMNDTFYGPFWRWKEYFDLMDSINVDFWGLSKFEESTSALLGGILIPEHLQGYFIVINNTILKSTDFLNFWKNMDDPKDYKQAIMNYEIGLTQYFSSLGYGYGSYLDINGDNKYLKPSECIYLSRPYSLIKEFKFPVLKRKACNAFNEEILDALRYIDEFTEYEISDIYDHLKDQTEINGISFSELREFYENHRQVYIYGKGNLGNIIKRNMDILGYKSSGFIVTKPQCNEEICFDEIRIQPNDGIIMAMNSKNIKEVIENVLNSVERRQLLIPRWKE